MGFLENRKCSQCLAEYPARTPSARFCSTCVPREHKAGMRARQNIALYGVDDFMYKAMYFEQDGKCMICIDREAVCVDHDHSTGEARGLLCLGCNTLLGFMEDPVRYTRALSYLEGELA